MGASEKMARYAKCGSRGQNKKRMPNGSYPKCVPTCKSHTDDRLSKGQSAGVVTKESSSDKRVQVVNQLDVPTFAPKRKKAMGGGFMARYSDVCLEMIMD